MDKLLNVKSNWPLVIRHLGGEYPSVSRDPKKRSDYRDGFGFTENDTVWFIVFCLQKEHEFGRALSQINPEDKVLIWPVDNRAREKLFVLHGDAINRLNGLVVEFDSHRAADKCIVFRKDWYVPEIVIPVEVI